MPRRPARPPRDRPPTRRSPQRPERPERPPLPPRRPRPPATKADRFAAATAPLVDLGAPSLTPLPEPGAWIFTCREGFERDLAEELLLGSKHIAPRLLAPALVATAKGPPRRDRRLDVTFARQAFPLAAAVTAPSTDRLAERVVAALRESAPLGKGPFTLHVWVPDSETGNRLSQAASSLQSAIVRLLSLVDPALAARREEDARAAGGMLAQVCLARADLAFVGALPVVEALSTAPGGRARMADERGAPSRAAMKLEEALGWLGVGPEAGDVCADLGAAPGGWTFVLAERRARVIAVDPGRLAPDLARRKNIRYVAASAFDWEPEEPVDWLFCDMAWRPLEVAALLARWGRRRLARTLVANVKLPMKRKAEMLRRVREIVESGGWRDVRTRHLYHDRDEITLTAWRR